MTGNRVSSHRHRPLSSLSNRRRGIVRLLNCLPTCSQHMSRISSSRVGDERFAILSKARFTTDMRRSHYPLLVTFTAITDPKTVQQVDLDNLAGTFGPGVLMKRITLEITDEPVTKGKIERVLGWWCDLRKKQARLNGSTSIGWLIMNVQII